jgi:predicted CXXCH cytochrome family protein
LQRTPGGDFAWLKKTFTYTYNGSTFTETGGGHKINAPVNGYPQASGTAPGGTFQSANLGCESCHDPHGKYRRLSTGAIATTGEPIKASGSYNNTTTNEPVAPGSTTSGAVGVYRILAGTGYATEGSGAIAYPGVPAAKAPSTYNQTETTNQVRVAYGVIAGSGHTTWGNWCGTCHASFHSTGNYVHPVDQGLGTTLATYNAYVKSGDMSGSTASSYLSLVPFASNGVTYVALSGLARNNSPFGAGPTNGDQVTCLSCHRAHASGFSHMLRFDQGYEFMTKGSQYIGSDNPEVGTGGRGPLQSRGRTNADWQAAYYDRPATQFATYQRVLCNKCHAKD